MRERWSLSVIPVAVLWLAGPAPRAWIAPAPEPIVYTVRFPAPDKHLVVGFLLDARIRRATEGAKTLDDLMKLAYQRYSGERGFTAEQFRKTAEEVAGVDLKGWFRGAVASTEELDYTEALDWFGLR